MGFVALCAEEELLRNPELLGLDGEHLDQIKWIRTYSEAQEARQTLANSHDVDESWVVSSDSVCPINLAAALKADSPARAVFLVAFSQSGSLKSRALSASIDGVLSKEEFAKKYRERKLQEQIGQLNIRPAHAKQEEKRAAIGPQLVKATQARMSLEDQAKAIVKNNIDTTGFKGPISGRKRARKNTDTSYEVHASAITVAPNKKLQEKEHEIAPETSAAKTTTITSKATPEASPKEPAFLLPVVSGSGGSGKSTVAAMAALLTQQAGLKTALIDLDLQFGDMKETLGLDEALHVEDLVEAPVRLKHLSTEEGMPAVLTVPRNLEQSEEIIKQLPELLDLVSENFDVVIVNTGSFWADEQVVLLERCSRALFLVDQRPSSLRACQRALDLCTRCGIATSPLIFAVNKCSKNGMYSSIDVSCALHGASSKELMWGGGAVEEYLAAGQAQALLETRNAFVTSLGTLLSEIVPAMPQMDSGRSSQGHASFLHFLGIE